MLGRWDLMVEDGDSRYPSWVELTQGGGQFVGQWGSARPIASVVINDTSVEWTLPRQYENRETDMVFRGTLEDGRMLGTTTNGTGETIRFVGHPVPDLPAVSHPQWEVPISLIGSNLDGWSVRWPHMDSNWSITDDGLDNAKAGTDLVTTQTFEDFHLVAEYKYPAGSNSGIYLRGRYEFQILDDFGREPSVGSSGAIYGFHQPNVNAVKPAGEWNVAEITLLGRYVTVRLNEVTILEHQEIPGITGGAIDSNEGEPGPIFVQGDHGPVTYRRLDISRRRV